LNSPTFPGFLGFFRQALVALRTTTWTTWTSWCLKHETNGQVLKKITISVSWIKQQFDDNNDDDDDDDDDDKWKIWLSVSKKFGCQWHRLRQ